MKHRVQINVASKEGTSKVLEGVKTKVRAGRLRRMFKGEYCEVICLRPGLQVKSIEIQEVEDGKQS